MLFRLIRNQWFSVQYDTNRCLCENTIELDVAAYTLGAQFIERSFTLDRTQNGSDHAASLEPGGMRRLSYNLAEVGESLTWKSKEIFNIEVP